MTKYSVLTMRHGKDAKLNRFCLFKFLIYYYHNSRGVCFNSMKQCSCELQRKTIGISINA